MLRSRIAAISATLAVVAVACGGASEVATDAGATVPETPAIASTAPGTTAPSTTAPNTGTGGTDDAPATSGPAANAEALQFTAQAVGGGSVDGVDYAGGDVVLWIWAPW